MLLACILAGPLLAEVAVRFLVLHPSELARKWGASMRDPGLFADPLYESEYWRLRWRLERTSEPTKIPTYDARLGWVGRRIAPGTYEHRQFEPEDPRRPILLYGASYATCLTSEEDCFEGLVERSDLGMDHVLLNHGVGGYGVDQTYLLMRNTLERYRERNPIVVIALVSDTDFDRCSIDFRSWPKPRLEVVDGKLEVAGAGTVTEGCEAFVDEVGVGIRSYAWRYLIRGTNLLGQDMRRKLTRREQEIRDQNALIRRIVLAIRDEVESGQLEYFFLLCVSPRNMGGKQSPNKEDFLLQLFAEENIPYVPTRPAVEAFRKAAGKSDAGLFLQQGRGKNHPTPAGNEVLFECLRKGFEGRFANGTEHPPADADDGQ